LFLIFFLLELYFFYFILHHFIDRDFVNISGHEFERFDRIGLDLFFPCPFLQLIFFVPFFNRIVPVSCARLRVSRISPVLLGAIFLFKKTYLLLLLLSNFLFFLSYYQINQGLTQLLNFSYSLKTQHSFKLFFCWK
jgi:hypothetical protein